VIDNVDGELAYMPGIDVWGVRVMSRHVVTCGLISSDMV
jgi:hypothetical protein